MFRKFYMPIQSLARKREILSWLFPFTESLTYMVANCGEQNLIEKLRISSVNRNRYLEKKIIDISEQYLVLEADILQNK